MAHILLIDDDRRLTEPLQAAFVNEGYLVSVAHNGRTGLELALTTSPDVVVLDVMMPELMGWDVCRSIRQQSSVPIIMLTAFDETIDRMRGLELGADDYLVKPFGFQALHAHVRAMLRRMNLDTHESTVRLLSAGDIEVNLATFTVSKAGAGRSHFAYAGFESTSLVHKGEFAVIAKT